jgi:hypothetical protein
MDILSAITSLTSQASGAAEYVIKGASDYIPEDVARVIKHAYSYFPTNIRTEDVAQFILYFAVASLILGVISRVVLGKRSSLNHSLSSAIGIGCIYILTVIIYTFRPWELEQLLSPLPFVTFSGEYLILLPIADAQFNALCQQILSLVILSFLVNLLDSIVPKGESILSWYILRLLTVALSMVLHLIVNWAMHTYLPELLVDYAPAVLLITLAVLLFSGIFSLVIGLVIAVSNPFLGAMYSFFFSSIIGKQISKAVFSSAVLCLAFWLIENFGYTVICISAAALTAYIPLVLMLLVLWYFIGHLL